MRGDIGLCALKALAQVGRMRGYRSSCVEGLNPVGKNERGLSVLAAVGNGSSTV